VLSAVTDAPCTRIILTILVLVSEMRLPLPLLLLLSHSLVSASPAKRSYSTHDYYVLEHNPSAGASLAECARELGVEVVEQAGELLNHWLVRINKLNQAKRQTEEDRVLVALSHLQRRAFSDSHSPFFHRSVSVRQARKISSSIKYLARQTLRQRTKRAPPDDPFIDGDASSSRAVAERLGIHDPNFPQQWHLVNDEFPDHMMNVTGLWEIGITGEGIISTLVDDGLDYTHPDLADNFVRATILQEYFPLY
jgi:kexin